MVFETEIVALCRVRTGSFSSGGCRVRLTYRFNYFVPCALGVYRLIFVCSHDIRGYSPLAAHCGVEKREFEEIQRCSWCALFGFFGVTLRFLTCFFVGFAGFGGFRAVFGGNTPKFFGFAVFPVTLQRFEKIIVVATNYGRFLIT